MNYMGQVAKILGVELEEEFIVEGCDDTIYKITKDGFVYYDNENDWQPSMLLLDILEGRATINKLPWKPEVGDLYYTYFTIYGEWKVGALTWTGNVSDSIYLKAGVIFKSEQLAKEALPRIYKELTGKEL